MDHEEGSRFALGDLSTNRSQGDEIRPMTVDKVSISLVIMVHFGILEMTNNIEEQRFRIIQVWWPLGSHMRYPCNHPTRL